MSHPDLLFDQLPGIVDLLRGTTYGEHLNVGVGVGWRVPLEFDPGPRLLADALDRLSPWSTKDGTFINFL